MLSYASEMSSSRDKPLTKEEQEEEEMRNELAEFGVDDHMPADEMKQLLSALKESKKEESFVDSPSPRETRSPPCNAETHTPKMPTPSYSYRNNITSDNGEKNVSEEKKSHMSPEVDYKKNSSFQMERNKTPEKETLNEKDYNLTNDFPPLGSHSNSKNTDLGTPKQWYRDNKRSSIMTKKMRIERYKLNPFHYEQNKDVLPLKVSEQFDEISNSPSLTVEDLDSDKFEELYNQMSEKLDRLHDVFCSSKATSGDSNTEWGLPIKVAKKWNGSLDKNLVVEKTSYVNNHSPATQIKNTLSPSDQDSKDSFNQDNSTSPAPQDANTSNFVSLRSTRATKRKAMENINIATQIDEGWDSDEEFVESKKRKTGLIKKPEQSEKKLQKEKDPDFEVIDIDKDGSDDNGFDNSGVHSLRKNKKQVPTNSKAAEEEPIYPRKITPPNPNNKKSYKGPRSKKKGQNLVQNNAMKKKMGITNEEISKTLEEIDAQIEDNDCVDITDEVKPSPVQNIKNKKLLDASSYLEKAHKNEEKKIKAAEEEKKKLEIQERLKKDKMISERLQEEENEKAKKLEKEKRCKEQTEYYNNFLKTKVTNPNIEKPKTPEEADEDFLLADEEESAMTRSKIKNQNSACPICQKSFPSDKIESHASECFTFSEVEDTINHQPSTSSRNLLHECYFCGKFKTDDGNKFEEHSVRCKERIQNKNNGYYC